MVIKKEDEEAGPERQRLDWGSAAMEEEDEEARSERQQVGWRGSSRAEEQWS